MLFATDATEDRLTATAETDEIFTGTCSAESHAPATDRGKIIRVPLVEQFLSATGATEKNLSATVATTEKLLATVRSRKNYPRPTQPRKIVRGPATEKTLSATGATEAKLSATSAIGATKDNFTETCSTESNVSAKCIDSHEAKFPASI